MKPAPILDRILERKQDEIAAAAAVVPEAEVRRRAESRPAGDRRPFAARLRDPGPRKAKVIAEIKRASPSKGLLRPDLDPASYAAAYASGGAAALSVLTDSHFFGGRGGDLEKARRAVPLPVLRKDFVVSTYQIYASAAMGADALLLIVRALPEAFLREALALCGDLGVDALVEIHSERELETATRAGAGLLGINNRDLGTFRTDIGNSIRIARHLDPGQTAVAESGIGGRGDVERLSAAGIYNFLVGESLVRAPDPAAHLRNLLGVSP